MSAAWETLEPSTREWLELYHLHRRLRECPDPVSEVPVFPVTFDEECLERIDPTLRGRPEEWIGWIPFFRNGTLGALSILSNGTERRVSFPLRSFTSEVLRVEPVGFYLFHNHPSQDLRPSRADHRLTRTVTSVFRALEIPLLGHGIIGIRRVHWIVLSYPKHENRSPGTDSRALSKVPRAMRLRSAETDREPETRARPATPTGTG